jgi:predicted DNA-binding transcriptional regulator AlpA
MITELETVLDRVRGLPTDELPRFLGDLETVRAVAWSRLTSPPHPAPENAADELLDVKAAAARLGISSSYLYRRHKQFPFTRRVGTALRFSSLGIQKFIDQSGILIPRRRATTLTPVPEGKQK